MNEENTKVVTTEDEIVKPEGEDKTIKQEEEKKASPKKKKKVKVNLPRLRGEKDQSVWACVNGRGILIQRGKTVEIDAEYAEVLKHSEKADEVADAFLDSLESGNED